MMFSSPVCPYEIKPDVVKALNVLLILHADHEQNCSTAAVRLVGSARVNLYASIAAGICALWGPLHGGANQMVIDMLEDMLASGKSVKEYVEGIKASKGKELLYGFGHRVYKTYDPRAKVIKKTVTACSRSCASTTSAGHRARAGGYRHARRVLHLPQPLPERGLLQRHHLPRARHPQRDVHRDVRAGASPGWIAQWKEAREDPRFKLQRPGISTSARTCGMFRPS
jgi:citrate synthase